MRNLINMQKYWILRSKRTWVLIILCAVLITLSTLMMKIEVNMANSNKEFSDAMVQSSDSVSVGVHTNIFTTQEFANNEKFSVETMIGQNYASNLVLLLACIFAVCCAISEIKNGYIKNMTCYMKQRSYYVYAKVFDIIMYSLVLVLIVPLFTILGSLLFFGYIRFTDIPAMIGMIGMQWLVTSALGIFAMLITIIFRSTALPIAFIVCCATGFDSLIMSLFNTLLKNALPSGCDLRDYVLSPYTSSVCVGSTSSTIIKCSIVAACYMVVSIIVSAIIMNKRDVK